jgi:anti-sigma B factor antagonist
MFFINHTDIGEGSAAIIEIEGPLNSDSAPDFDDYVSKLADNNVINLLLDMKNLDFISSEGIGAAIMLQKSINSKNGIAVFFNLNYEITSLFKLLGFNKLFTIASDRADALQILDRHMELFRKDNTGPKSGTAVRNDFESFEDGPSLSENDLSDSDSFTVFEDIIEDTADSDMISADDEEKGSFIIECVKCRSLIRIKDSGDQLCPHCSAEFTVTDNKQAVFKIKEIY